MDVQSATIVATGTDPDTGYDSFRLGGFEFRRDEYFAHIEWPKGSHIIEIDRFLRAMVRDIGWGFFYGWIFFDDIFGTTNHYGTVDVFAGAYDQGYKDQGLDYLETFPAEVVKEAFETISQNWINEGYDPLNAPLETGSPLGPKTKERSDPLVRGFAAASRMLGLAGEPPVRSGIIKSQTMTSKLSPPSILASASFALTATATWCLRPKVRCIAEPTSGSSSM